MQVVPQTAMEQADTENPVTSKYRSLFVIYGAIIVHLTSEKTIECYGQHAIHKTKEININNTYCHVFNLEAIMTI